MRLVFLAILTYTVLSVVACGPKGHPDEPVTCDLLPSNQEVTYPDGVTRKSNVYACSNGCGIAKWVNDESIQFEQCDLNK